MLICDAPQPTVPPMSDVDHVMARVREIERRLEALECERRDLMAELAALRRPPPVVPAVPMAPSAPVTMASPTVAKIALFRSLFRGRGDVFPRRWENPQTG